MNDEIDWQKVCYMIMHVTDCKDMLVEDHHYIEMEKMIRESDPTVILIHETVDGTRVQLVKESEALKQEADYIANHPALHNTSITH